MRPPNSSLPRATQSQKSNSRLPQNQVRPHFYLSTCFHDSQHAPNQGTIWKSRSWPRWSPTTFCVTSFKPTKISNRLADEIQHIWNYLEIQKISIHFWPGLGSWSERCGWTLSTLWKMPSNTAFLSKIPSTFSFPFMKKELSACHFLQDNGPGFSPLSFTRSSREKSLPEDGHHIV